MQDCVVNARTFGYLICLFCDLFFEIAIPYLFFSLSLFSLRYHICLFIFVSCGVVVFSFISLESGVGFVWWEYTWLCIPFFFVFVFDIGWYLIPLRSTVGRRGEVFCFGFCFGFGFILVVFVHVCVRWWGV